MCGRSVDAFGQRVAAQPTPDELHAELATRVANPVAAARINIRAVGLRYVTRGRVCSPTAHWFAARVVLYQTLVQVPVAHPERVARY